MSKKIYKMPNGEFKEVSSEDENHFLEQLEKKNITAELVVDESTSYDEVISVYSKEKEEEEVQIEPIIEQEEIIDDSTPTSDLDTSTDPNITPDTDPNITPDADPILDPNTIPDTDPIPIHDTPLGDGADFAASIPNKVITLKNGLDYYNFRTEANLFNNHYDSNYLLQLKEDQESVPQTQRDEDWDNKQDLYELYDQNSGYIPLYGNKDTWDANAVARNKEVKDAIFSGEYGYNPHTDELTKLETPIDVNLYDQARA